MITKKYKSGGFVTKIISPVDFPDKPPYSDFLYDGEQTDYTVQIEIVDSLPFKIDNACYYDNMMTVKTEDNKQLCYYKTQRESGFYACRITNAEKKSCRILIPEKYSHSLWARVIFSVIGIEEIAAVNNAVVFHASVVEKNGTAILFTGECGIGKSTQAALWEKFSDAEIINGDKALLYEKDGAVFVSGLPFSGSSGICKNKALSVKAIIALGKSPFNNLQKQTTAQGFLTLIKNTYEVPYSREIQNIQANTVQRLAERTETYKFNCLPDESAVRYLEKELC